MDKIKKWAAIITSVLLIATIVLIVTVSGKAAEQNGLKEKNTLVTDCLSNVEITKPKEGYLYINDREIIPLISKTIIIGPITVEVSIAYDNDIGRVEFYIDDVLKHTDYNAPYSWLWDKLAIGGHEIKVAAYEIENPYNVAYDSKKVFIFNRGSNEVIPPSVWITNPMANDLLYESEWSVAPVTENTIEIRAARLNGSEDIASTLFEYSSDGKEWTTIGVDDFGGFEGFVFDNGSNRKVGSEGWNIIWNLSNLPEGHYFIRATMNDITGRVGNCTREIFVDRTPPKPLIYKPAYGGVIGGTAEFCASTNSSDIVSMELFLFDTYGIGPRYIFEKGGPGSYYEQKHVGSVDQSDVGNDGKGGTNHYCSPTAAANALSELHDEKIYPPGKNGDNLALAKALAESMGTDQNTGTDGWTKTKNGMEPGGKFESGLKSYLEKRKVGCSNKKGYQIKTYKVEMKKVKINGKDMTQPIKNKGVTFKAYNNEIRKNQAVMLAITKVYKGRDMKYYTNDDVLAGSHMLTGKGADSKEKIDSGTKYKYHTIRYVNPDWGSSEWGRWETHNGYSYINYQSDVFMVTGMWAVSPKQKESTKKLGTDTNPEDGLCIPWDTTNIEDGWYTLILEMKDKNGFIGTDTMVVEVNNSKDEIPPETTIITPPDGTEFDESGIEVSGTATDNVGVVEFGYHYQWDGGETSDSWEVGNLPTYEFTFPLVLHPDWNEITVYAKDAAGNEGSDSVTVYYYPEGDTTPPVTTEEVGQPSSEGGYKVTPGTPIWLNATDDSSGVANIHYEVWSDEDGDNNVDTMKANITATAPSVEIHFAEYDVYSGIAELHFYATDNAGNIEEMKVKQHLVQE